MLRLAGDVRIHVTVKLKPPRDPGVDEPLDGAEDGRPPQRGLRLAHDLVQLRGRQLTSRSGEGIGDDQPLLGHALAGRGEPVGGRGAHATTLAQPRLRIMLA